MASLSNPTSSNFTGDGKGEPIRQDARTFTFTFGTAKSNVQTSSAPQQWVRDEYKRLHCNFLGTLVKPVDVEALKRDLQQQRQHDATSIAEVIRELDEEITREVCKEFALDGNGSFTDYASVLVELSRMRPDLAERKVVAQVLARLEERNKADRPPSEHLPPILQPPAFTSTDQQSDSPQIGSQAEVITDSVSILGSASITTATPDLSSSLASRGEPPTTNLSKEQASEVFAVAQQECDRLNWADHIRPLNRAVVISALARKWPEIGVAKLEEVAIQAEQAKSCEPAMTRAKKSGPAAPEPSVHPGKRATEPTQPPKLPFPPDIKEADFDTNTELGLEAWVHWRFLKDAFYPDGEYKKIKWLRTHLCKLKPKQTQVICKAITKLFKPGQEFSFPDPRTVRKNMQIKARKDARMVQSKQSKPPPATKSSNNTVQAPNSSNKALPKDLPVGPTFDGCPIPVASSSLSQDQEKLRIGLPGHTSQPISGDGVANVDLLARKLDQMHSPRQSTFEVMHTSMEDDESSTCCSEGRDSGHEPLSQKSEAEHETSAVQRPSKFLKLDPERMRIIFFDDSESEEEELENAVSKRNIEIQQAPLIDEVILIAQTRQLIPQYGLLGLRRDAEKSSKSPLYLNTNVPFSAFICGVQGSGKSHTASCLMENALIPSEDLGELQNPLSALVFSYGHFSGDGAGFSISEAAFLAGPNPRMATRACVKKVNVLVSPSNFVRISKLYCRIPNVSVTMFKLKPWNLGIDVMLTLMNVSESDEAPLYMAQVTQILRQMAASGRPFNYGEFKHHVNQQRFDYKQVNMLQMRLNLLESFLDLNDSCPEPQFRAGEITIMDMSCPFVDANTACILFRLGLQRYLQSNVPGKLILLDEAHKYMLNVPGARSLNEKVLDVIRLQRHYGARVIVSTQEPTLLTSLIALCSITILHRFSSPEWFAAVKRHIPVQKEHSDTVLHRIENLETGNSLVYSSKAILGRDGDGRLLNGAGKLLEVKVRKRITSDGGQSIVAV